MGAHHALLLCSRNLFDSGIAFESDARRRHEIPETTRKCTSKAAKMGAIAQCNAPPHAGGEWMPYRFRKIWNELFLFPPFYKEDGRSYVFGPWANAMGIAVFAGRQGQFVVDR